MPSRPVPRSSIPLSLSRKTMGGRPPQRCELWRAIRIAAFKATDDRVAVGARKWGDNRLVSRRVARHALPRPGRRRPAGNASAADGAGGKARGARAAVCHGAQKSAPTLITGRSSPGTLELMRNRDPGGFDRWLEDAHGSELASFADGFCGTSQLYGRPSLSAGARARWKVRSTVSKRSSARCTGARDIRC